MIPTLDCDTPFEGVCCVELFDLADGLLEAVTNAIAECLAANECSTPPRTYVSVGEPNDPASDYLAVFIANIVPTASTGVMPVVNVELGVKLLEEGWPTPDGDAGIQVPSAEAVLVASMHSYAHGERMTRAIWNWMRGLTCCRTQLLRVDPIPPSGGSVGWQARILVEHTFQPNVAP